MSVSSCTAMYNLQHRNKQWLMVQPDLSPNFNIIWLLQDSIVIGSRLDASQEAATCRLAFYGRILKLLNPTDSKALQQVRIYKLKQKQGSIDRVSPDGMSAVCKGMFKKETDLGLFSGMQVWLPSSSKCTGTLASLLVACRICRNLRKSLANANCGCPF